METKMAGIHVEVASKTRQDMSRVLYRHDWTDVREWVRSVDELADLPDEEITRLVPETREEGAPLNH